MTNDPATILCQTHGLQPLRVLDFGHVGPPMVIPGCPKCSHEAAERELAQRTERERAEILARSLIPPQYHGATLRGFPATTPQQRAVIAQCRDFVVGYERLRVTAEKGSWLVLSGIIGAGKTGMACAIALALMTPETWQQDPHPPRRLSLFHTVASMRRHAWDARARGSSESAAIEELVNAENLILDELGATTNSDAERSTVLEVANQRYNRRRPMIWISNLTLAQMSSALDPQILSRIHERAHVLECSGEGWEDLRLRKAA